MTASHRALNRASLSMAAHDLARSDRGLAAVVRQLGVPPMWGRRPGFSTLIQIILEQQVSLSAARTMYLRLRAHLGDMTPVAVHEMHISGLREFGLTRQKARYCVELATRLLEGSLDLSAVARSQDLDGRQILLAIPGLGPWSVDIYYLMALRRPDVWPQGDLALAVALRDVKRLRHIPDRDEQQRISRSWKPWRSVAARILWAHYLAARGQLRS